MHLLQCLYRGTALAMIALLAACATYTDPGVEPPPEPPVVEPPPEQIRVPTPPGEYQTPPRAATHSASAAWRPLLAQAEQATERGDFEQALAVLARAQRIDPDSAEVYLSIARTQRAKGDAVQARATAERGLLYCSSEAVCNSLRALTR